MPAERILPSPRPSRREGFTAIQTGQLDAFTHIVRTISQFDPRLRNGEVWKFVPEDRRSRRGATIPITKEMLTTMKKTAFHMYEEFSHTPKLLIEARQILHEEILDAKADQASEEYKQRQQLLKMWNTE